MKHTYLYPLEDGELPLWRMARMGAADLFGDVHESDVQFYLGLSDALGEAREELHKRLESRDRICIGRHYVIPGSLCEVAQDRARSADGVVREITELLWDAPIFRGDLYTLTFAHLKRSAGRGGRDAWGGIDAFLRAHTEEPEGSHRIIPVWM